MPVSDNIVEAPVNKYVYVLTRSRGLIDFSDRPYYRHLDKDVFVAVFPDKKRAVRLCVDELGMRTVVNFEDYMEFESAQVLDSECSPYRFECESDDEHLYKYINT